MSNAIYRKTNRAVQIHLFYSSNRLDLPGFCMWITCLCMWIKYTNCWDENTVKCCFRTNIVIFKKRETEGEMVGWHHWFNGPEFEQAPGNSEGQGSLACCCPWGCKEADMTEQLNNKDSNPSYRWGHWGSKMQGNQFLALQCPREFPGGDSQNGFKLLKSCGQWAPHLSLSSSLTKPWLWPHWCEEPWNGGAEKSQNDFYSSKNITSSLG